MIMLHHLGQRVSASWVPELYRKHGLEPFVPIGYLLVSFFFFCSGYGLIKSMKSKEHYFRGFLVRRLNRILLVFVITELIYFGVRVKQNALQFPLNPYSWFVYSIIILYIGFYLIYRKENKYSLLLMAGWILIYSFVCFILVKGNWWYNAAPAFLLGIYMAGKEEKEKEEKDNHGPKITAIILSACVFIITFIVSENAISIYRALDIHNYTVINTAIVLIQIISCCSFSLFIYLLTLKFKDRSEKGNEKTGEIKRENILHTILSFYGSFTLEFYLIHGLFVQMFSHHFMNDSNKAVYYIKNVPVYVIVVFVLSTVSAFAIKKLEDFTTYSYKNSEDFQQFIYLMEKAAFVLFVIAVIATVFLGINRARVTKAADGQAQEFKDEYLKTVDAGGKSIAVYDSGSGRYNVVLISSDTLPCSTLHLKPLADLLSDDYRVIVLDFPGTGFSEDSDDVRTSDFYADTVKETLDALGIKDNIILVPHVLSGLYAYRYMEKYPEGVSAMACVDAVVPQVGLHFLDGNFSSVDEYKWFIHRYVKITGLMQEFMVRTGYITLQLPMYEYMYKKEMLDYIPVMEKMYVEDYLRGAHLSENGMAYDNCMSVMDFKLPSDLPVVFMLSDYMKNAEPYGVNWMTEYKKMITDEDKQLIKILVGDPYSVYYNPKLIKQKIDELVSSL